MRENGLIAYEEHILRSWNLKQELTSGRIYVVVRHTLTFTSIKFYNYSAPPQTCSKGTEKGNIHSKPLGRLNCGQLICILSSAVDFDLCRDRWLVKARNNVTEIVAVVSRLKIEQP